MAGLLLGKLKEYFPSGTAHWGGMGTQHFDERYPAMFQPGGEALPAGAHWPVKPVAAPAPVAEQASVPAASRATEQQLHLDAPPAALEPAESVIPVAAGPVAAPTNSPRLMWHVPAVLGGVLLLMGVLLPVVPYWFVKPSGLADGNHLGPEMWSYIAAQAAAPMVGVGAGALALLLFLYTQRHPTRREGLRRLFATASAAVLAAALFAQFATYLYPPIQQESVDPVSGEPAIFSSVSTFVYILGFFAFGLLLVGLLMLAALAITHRTSLIRAYAVGLLLLAAAVFSQFAEQIFPNVPYSTHYFEGGNRGLPGWPAWLPMLTPALVAAGVIVIACAALGPAVAAAVRAAMPVPMPVPKPERPDEEGSAVEPDEDHVQTEL